MTDTPTAAFATEQRDEVVTQPKKVLNHVVGKSLSGCLTFQDLRSPSIHWQLYIRSGQLAYATSAVRRHERLACLVRNHPDLLNQPIADDASEYSEICTWWHRNGLPMAKLRQLLMRLSLEALVQILALPKTCVALDRAMRLDPVLIETPLASLPAPLLQMAAQWQQWGNILSSPFDRLRLDDGQHPLFNQMWQERPLTVRGQQQTTLTLPLVMREVSRQRSMYQIAGDLGVSVNSLVAWAIPFVNAGVLSFAQPSTSEETKRAVSQAGEPISELKQETEPKERLTIACIDDSKTVQKHVKGILNMSGYDVLGITEPTQALTALVRQRPAVILMDVNMPNIDGYELCSMLRQSRQLREIPIVMLTGRDGLLDRLRAKTLGVEYYLTKPFNPERLLESIKKAINTVESSA